MTVIVFFALFSFLTMLVRGSSPARGGVRLREEIDALFSGEHEYRPVAATDFPEADIAFYSRMQRELEGLGFRTLGDLENLTVSRVYPESRTFIRFLIDDAALIRAAVYHMRPRGAVGGMLAFFRVVPRHVHVVELVSEVPRGRFLVTAPTRGLDGLDSPPEVTAERLPPGTPVKKLVERHRLRLQEYLRTHGDRTPVAMDSLDALLASVQRGHVVASRHRQKVGRLSKDELERMTGEPLDEDDAAMLREVQRKPRPEPER